MGRDPTHQVTPDSFSTAVGGVSSPARKQISSSHELRHVLPKDLPNAVKHLNDEELDRLLAATLAEAKRRGRDTTPTEKRYPSRNTEAAVSLTRGQLNAVRAAFKAGITPARIARQFGLSQSGVRTALKSDKGDECPKEEIRVAASVLKVTNLPQCLVYQTHSTSLQPWAHCACLRFHLSRRTDRRWGRRSRRFSARRSATRLPPA